MYVTKTEKSVISKYKSRNHKLGKVKAGEKERTSRENRISEISDKSLVIKW